MNDLVFHEKKKILFPGYLNKISNMLSSMDTFSDNSTRPKSQLHSRSQTNSQCALVTLIVLPIIANFFARNLAEYLFDLVVLVALALAPGRLKSGKWKELFIPTGFNWIWVVFFVVVLLGYIINGTLGVPQIKDLAFFAWAFAMFFYARLLTDIKASPQWLYGACVFICGLSVALILNFFLFPETPNFWSLPNRLRGTFTNTNFLAHSYSLVLFFLLGLFSTQMLQPKSKYKWPLLAAIVLLTCTLLLTFNRSIWITAVLILPIMFFKQSKKISLIAVLSFMFFSVSMYLADVGPIRARIHATLNPAQSGDLGRINLWKANLHAFLQNPILGVGYYNNTRDIQSYYNELGLTEGTIETHAHNEVLSFLAGTGVVGTFIFLSIFVLFFLLAHKTLKKIPVENSLERGLLTGALWLQPAFLINGIADNNFEIHVARNFLVLSWALIIAFAHKNEVQLVWKRK